jgi:hypothetical protein
MTAILPLPTGWIGTAIVWGFMGIAVWILLIALIVLIVRAMRTTARDPQAPAVRLLEDRYARGEISRDEVPRAPRRARWHLPRRPAIAGPTDPPTRAAAHSSRAAGDAHHHR